MMRDSFSEYHPFNNFLYFVLVIGFSLALSHPLAQGVALVCAMTYIISIDGKKCVVFTEILFADGALDRLYQPRLQPRRNNHLDVFFKRESADVGKHSIRIFCRYYARNASFVVCFI